MTKQENTLAHFSSLDVVSGEVQTGYIDKNGRPQLRNPLSWWRRMLGQKATVPVWSEWKTIKSIDGKQRYTETGMFTQTRKFIVPYIGILQTRSNSFTHVNEYRVSDIDGGWKNVDTVIFERENEIVAL